MTGLQNTTLFHLQAEHPLCLWKYEVVELEFNWHSQKAITMSHFMHTQSYTRCILYSFDYKGGGEELPGNIGKGEGGDLVALSPGIDWTGLDWNLEYSYWLSSWLVTTISYVSKIYWQIQGFTKGGFECYSHTKHTQIIFLGRTSFLVENREWTYNTVGGCGIKILDLQWNECRAPALRLRNDSLETGECGLVC